MVKDSEKILREPHTVHAQWQFVNQVKINLEHIGEVVPTGGRSGDMKVGNGKLWINDRGTWVSTTLS